MGKVVYLGYYCNDLEKKKVSPAGNALMKYVINVIEKTNKELIVISPAQDNIFSKKKVLKFSKRTEIYLPSYANNVIFMKFVNRWRRNRNLYRELMSILEDGDNLIVYHSLVYINVLKKIRKRKKVNLILQVCEIYADVINDHILKEKEIKWIKSANKYIFSTQKIESVLNTECKEYAICMGIYKYNDDKYINQFKDKLIHIVYAGTFDSIKGGCKTAIKIAPYLNCKYHLHILGFGTKREISQIREMIDKISKNSSCKITYDGLKYGKDYINFIKSCHIGLSTQNPDKSFNDTSFPSKILSYMSNGLRVVSVKIPVIQESSLAKFLYLYDTQNSQEIANVIMNIDLNDDYDSKFIIDKLDKEFYIQLLDLIK